LPLIRKREIGVMANLIICKQIIRRQAPRQNPLGSAADRRDAAGPGMAGRAALRHHSRRRL
jgi:hypothetical protein